jgi:hypothetical protein
MARRCQIESHHLTSCITESMLSVLRRPTLIESDSICETAWWALRAICRKIVKENKRFKSNDNFTHQHEPHCPWFLIGVVMFLQSIEVLEPV